LCQNPEISIVKASVSDTGNCIVFEVDDTIDYTFTVTNEGDVDITNVVVTDSNLEGVVAGPASGDTNTNNILDVGEVWMYEASHIIMQADIDNGSVLNTADVNGNTALGDVDHTSNTVTVLICTSSSIALIRV
jgi:large repetitive protein